MASRGFTRLINSLRQEARGPWGGPYVARYNFVTCTRRIGRHPWPRLGSRITFGCLASYQTPGFRCHAGAVLRLRRIDGGSVESMEEKPSPYAGRALQHERYTIHLSV
jgi:hypothetical protein